MTAPARILIVEDEPAIRTGLVDVFVFHGYEVDYSERGPEGLEKALNGKFDLILLDVMLPGMNGFDICNEIRQNNRHQAIIMLTAKNSDEEIIKGLKFGADDYVSKPFSIAQLVLRVKAVLRRSLGQTEQLKTIALAGDIHIEPHNLTGSNGSTGLTFTKREIDMLSFLAENSSRAVSREELLAKVWGYAPNLDLETRTVDIHIAKLRRKIETNPKQPKNLITVRGAGYRLLILG